MKGLLRFDLGTSLRYNESVFSMIMSRFPNTVILSISSLFLALLFGIPIGIISASKKGSFIDFLFTSISLLGVSIPVFWLGVMLVLFFSVNLGWFPAMRMESMSEGLSVYIKHLVLPSITLATIPMANFTKILKSSILDVKIGRAHV